MENFKFAIVYSKDDDITYCRSVMNNFLKSISILYGFQCTIHPDHQVSSEFYSSDHGETECICDIACFESSYKTARVQKLVEVLNEIRLESEIDRYVFDFFESHL